MIVKGENVYLTSYTEDSLGLLYAWHQEEEFDKMMSDEAGPKSTDMLKQIYGKFLYPHGRLFIANIKLSEQMKDDQIKRMGDVYWNQKDSLMPIGVVALKDISMRNRRAEIYGGIGIPSMRKKGFANDAIITVLNWAQAELGLRRVSAVVREDNKLSLNTLESCGFTRETIMKDYLYSNRKFMNAYLLAHTKRLDVRPGKAEGS